jgi:4,5-DOPA dioxygenase extradiol
MERKAFIKSIAAITLTPFIMKLNDLHSLSNSLANSATMPVLFMGHGSPMNAIEDNEFSRKWKQIGKELPTPLAILCISAHWETSGTYVTAMQKPKMIYDFGGFPEELFQVKYPAPGSPELAEATKEAVTKTEIGLTEQWGLDHGAWSVIKNLFPNANIPVVQLSLDYHQNAQNHYDLAKQLQALRNKGVLIIGSGNMVHNLSMVAWDKIREPEYGYDWAIEADTKMKSFIRDNNHQALINFKSQGKAFDLAIPTPEHYLPMLYALALKNENEKLEFFNDKLLLGSLTMTSFKIG